MRTSSKRIFKGEIRNQSRALLLLDIKLAETDKTGITQQMLCRLGVFVYA